jgi:hypothetical protein
MSQIVVNPRYLRHLASLASISSAVEWSKGTYWENEIHDIHNAQNQVGYLGLVVSVAGENQEGCDNVVCEHLPMVLSPLLDIDHEYLLQPERVLDQNVPFAYSRDLSIGPIGPEILEIVHVVRVDQNVLPSLDFDRSFLRASSYHSQRPENRIVNQEPGLLSKSGLVPLSLRASLLCERS